MKTQSLGAVAYPGGVLVCRPELTVGVVHAVSRPSALEVELLARRLLARRSEYGFELQVRVRARAIHWGTRGQRTYSAGKDKRWTAQV